MKDWFYTKNTELLESPLNKTFEEILDMTKPEFRQWCIDFRKMVVRLWDEEGKPPVVGYTKQEIIDGFNEMLGYPVHEFLKKDELTGEENVIRNTSNFSGYVNAFFPTMMKTRINYNKNDDGKSIYDFFAKDGKFLDSFITYSTRHFKRDSFFHYSLPVRVNNHAAAHSQEYPAASNGVDWIKKFEKEFRSKGTHDYWLAPRDNDHEYTGYNEELREVKNIFINEEEIESILNLIPKRAQSNINYNKSKTYQIRIFKLGQKLFPVGLKAFRVSYCQYAVNFPPATAKFLYERFTSHIKDQPVINIYDPSSGWGGRIVGAMACNDDRNIHYIGTDPNTDHTTTKGRTKYHEVADFFNNNTYKSGGLFPSVNTYEIFQEGSEVIKNNPEFQKYKGKIDLVFTSPPYFAKEAYSEDPTQSYKKFSQYESWVEGFLRPTLETAVEYLRPNRYLLWNIADAKFGPDMLPLEEDSNKILASLGMTRVGTLKMALAAMPGSNRLTEDGKATAKNFCKVNGNVLKYEPIFCWKKPA